MSIKRNRILALVALSWAIQADFSDAATLCETVVSGAPKIGAIPKLFLVRPRATGEEVIEIKKNGQMRLPNVDNLKLVLVSKNQQSGRSILKVGIQQKLIVPAKRVHLQKRGSHGRCERERQGFIGRILNSLSGGEASAFQTGKKVRIEEYRKYHLEDEANGSERLYSFHDAYESVTGKCEHTDDARNGNRRQFLFSHPSQRNKKSDVSRYQSVVDSFSSKKAMGIAPKKREDIGSSFGAHNFDKLFVHMLGVERRESKTDEEYACKPVELAALKKGDDVVVQFNRLTFRNKRKQRYPEIVFRFKMR